jgi:hypothetical protein
MLSHFSSGALSNASLLVHLVLFFAYCVFFTGFNKLLLKSFVIENLHKRKIGPLVREQQAQNRNTWHPSLSDGRGKDWSAQ